jgi:asparagine synthase (glutamine-hydrolysing)
MRDRMACRGPDGAGLWVAEDGRVGLAHRRLAIIDLSEAGAQPMADPETGDRIVFNGEIYNYRELRAELEARGIRFTSRSDTEVLLKLYGCFGADMLPRLRGMFGFALWDARRRGCLFARDPFGIKPLYVADDGATLRFGSQVKALVAGGRVDTSPSAAGIVGFFVWGHVPEPFTPYRGIRALPSGTALWVGHDARREWRYFDLTAELKCQPSDPPSHWEEARHRLGAALRNSVRAHLVADVPVAIFLSAGLDSSTVAALAAEVSGASLRSFTLGFREYAGGPFDEVPLAAVTARRHGTVHETRWVRKEDFAADLEPLLDAMDQPSIDGVNTYFVVKAARGLGIKVALSGLGGDEMLAGYSSFREIPRAVRLLRPWSKVPPAGRLARRLAAPVVSRFVSPKYAGLLEYGGDWAGAYLLRRGLFMPWELPDLLDPDIAAAGLSELDTLGALRATIAGVEPDRLKVMALETAWYMRNQLLRDTDWASMAHSVEVRVPLVDVEVFRAVVSCVQAGYPVGKQDMARLPRRGLPPQVLGRPKTGFSVPVPEWLALDSVQPPAGPLLGRGLRGWALHVASRWPGFSVAVPGAPAP